MRDIKQKSKKYYQKLNKESQLEDITDLKDEESENNSIDELYEEYEKIYGYHDMDMLIQNKENKGCDRKRTGRRDRCRTGSLQQK